MSCSSEFLKNTSKGREICMLGAWLLSQTVSARCKMHSWRRVDSTSGGGSGGRVYTYLSTNDGLSMPSVNLV